MYNWRKLSDTDRKAIVKERQVRKLPWHAPPHFSYEGEKSFIITAACYEHQRIIGKSPARMAEFESILLTAIYAYANELFTWCILPNHYHVLLRTDRIDELLKQLGKVHGSSSYRWNGEDDTRGRKVWYKSVERSMRSERHFKASLNYILNNPVKHGYVSKWQDWPYSNAAEYLEKVGRREATKIWKEYPVLVTVMIGILTEP